MFVMTSRPSCLTMVVVRACSPVEPTRLTPARRRGHSHGSRDEPTARLQDTWHYDTGRTGWTGWIAFAGVLMIISGGVNALYGLVAAVNDDWVVWTNRSSLLLDLSQWGWVHMVVGLVLLLAGIGVFSGNVLARTVGVIVAALSLIANFFFIPAYPVWSIAVVTIDLLIIWALTAHGGEMRHA